MKAFQRLFLIPSAHAGAVTDFKFCITKLKIVSSADGVAGTSQEAILGLVDVSDAAVSNSSWGKIEIAEGATVSEVHFEVHHDSENCSAAYSASYNGTTITQDLEFKFKFDPAITVNHGDTLTLGLSKIAKAFEDAKNAGKLNNVDISAYMQANPAVGEGTEN